MSYTPRARKRNQQLGGGAGGAASWEFQKLRAAVPAGAGLSSVPIAGSGGRWSCCGRKSGAAQGLGGAVIEAMESRVLLSAYTLNLIASFKSTNGSAPYADLVMDSSGDLFGTTYSGGASGDGTVFEIAHGTPTTITTLASFNGTNGKEPTCALVLDSSGDLFGTTWSGGAYGAGTVFEIAASTPTTITTLVSFTGGADGASPRAALVMDSSGNLFGTTSGGGIGGNGTVFEIAASTPTTITTLVSFTGGADGANPYCSLVIDSSGDLFGTTANDGAGNGTVFEIAYNTPTTITTLASFNGTNGARPHAGLVMDSSGDLFGTTEAGGANGDGTVFEIAAGIPTTITTLASFDGANGDEPQAGLVLDSSGDLFGTTYHGGASGDNGTVFEIAASTPTTITTLVSFNGFSDGGGPLAALVLDSSGDLFGTTESAGPLVSYGTVFELTPGSGTSHTSQLAFAREPATTTAGATLSPVTVDVKDANGSLVTTDNSEVTLTLNGGSGGATLGGTTTVAAVNGVASFGNLSITTPGDNYTLAAADGTLSSATSTAFNITAAATTSSLVPALGSVKLPSSVLPGAKVNAKVPLVITNQGSVLKGSSVTVNIFADTGTSLDGNQALITSLTKKVSLKTGQSQKFNFNIKSLPSTLGTGTYYLLAEIIDSSGLTNVTATTQTTTVAAAFFDLAPALVKVPAAVKAGKKGVVSVTVFNHGNVAASGNLAIDLQASTDGSIDDSSIDLGAVTHPISIQPGKKVTLALSEIFPDSGGPYFVVADVDPADTFSESVLSNNVLASSTQTKLA